MDAKKFYRIKELPRFSETTWRRIIRAGRIKIHRNGERGWILIQGKDIISFFKSLKR